MCVLTQGFHDTDMCLRLLQQHNADEQAVVNDLLRLKQREERNRNGGSERVMTLAGYANKSLYG